MKNEMKSPSNFERLVLRCMDSYDSDQIVILQHFSRSDSTRFSHFYTAQISKFQKKTSNFLPGVKRSVGVLKNHLYIFFKIVVDFKLLLIEF